MKNNIVLIILIALPALSFAQIDGNLLLGLHHATATEIITMTSPVEGSLLYNSSEKKIMTFDGATWVDVYDLPADLSDGDDDTTYVAGQGLLLGGNTFSVDNTTIAPDWSNLTSIPTNLDLSNSNEIQLLTKTGNSISLNSGGGTITETETILFQNTVDGVITYTRESGTTSTANIVSTDTDNVISVGADGGAYLNLNISTTTIEVDQSFLWAGVVNDTDIHSTGTLTVNETRNDIGWSLSGPSTISYSGTPDYIEIDLMAVANNTGNHWAHPHIKVFRNGTEIGEGSGLHLDDSGTYSGRTTTVISMIDSVPGANPVYSFTTLEDDTRVMNDATITSLSPVSLLAIEKVDVVVSISN